MAINFTYTPFEDRSVQYPGKRYITRPDSSIELCTIARTSNGQDAEGVIYDQGTPIVASSFNDQLDNIKNAFDNADTELAAKQATLNAGNNITLTPELDGTVTIDADGGSGAGGNEILCGDNLRELPAAILDANGLPPGFAASTIPLDTPGFELAPGSVSGETIKFESVSDVFLSWNTYDLTIRIADAYGAVISEDTISLTYGNSGPKTIGALGFNISISNIEISDDYIELTFSSVTMSCYISGLFLIETGVTIPSNDKDAYFLKRLADLEAQMPAYIENQLFPTP